MTALDLLTDPDLMAQAKTEFEEMIDRNRGGASGDILVSTCCERQKISRKDAAYAKASLVDLGELCVFARKRMFRNEN
ncbi:MAG: hypothetical protein R2932_08255 [Caldilineaceae bacterium]